MLNLPQAVARLEAKVQEVPEKRDNHAADTRSQFEKVKDRLNNLEGTGYERNTARQAVARAGIL